MKLIDCEEICFKQIYLIQEALTPSVGTCIRRSGRDANADRFFYNDNAGSFQQWDDGSISIGDADVVFIPRRLEYTDNITSEGRSLIAYVDLNLPYTDRIIKWSFQENLKMKQHFLMLYNIWKQQKSGYYIQCMSELYAILSMIWRSEKANYTCSSSFSTILTAVDYMKANFADVTLNIPSLAECCGLSYSHFRKLFFDINGMSANTYLQKLRIDQASRILLTGDYTITQTADMSGFSDVYYFSSFFKKHTGMTPTEYLQKKRT